MIKIWLFTQVILISTAYGFQIVDINSASSDQIALLPGIGEKLAKEIVSYRNQHGPFKALTSLKAIPNLTPKKVTGLADKISFSRKKNLVEPPSPTVILLAKPLMNITELETHVLTLERLDHDFDLSIKHRARTAPWLPKLTAYVDTDHQNLSTRSIKENNDAKLTRGAKDIGFGIRLIFDFDKLIFNSDELEIAKLTLKRLEKREEIIAKLHKNYFRYVSLQESIKKPLDITVAESIALEMQQIEALLDFMSGGEFKKYQHRRQKMEPS